jgi:hypothetical protein
MHDDLSINSTLNIKVKKAIPDDQKIMAGLQWTMSLASNAIVTEDVGEFNAYV